MADSDRVHGTWQGPDGPEEVSFKRRWGKHTFTDEEVERLLGGRELTIKGYPGKNGKCDLTGKLGPYSFTNRDGEQVDTFGFHLVERADDRVSGIWNGPDGPEEVRFKRKWGKHTFTDSEIDELLAGGEITIHDYPGKKGKCDLTGKLGHHSFTTDDGKVVETFGFFLPERG